MILFDDVSRAFNGRVVLNHVSFEVEKGETFVIIGQSGTGKTVTLKHIAGLLEPDSGDVIVSGKRMNGASRRVREELRNRMGVVFQSGALINWMTVGDNVALPMVEHKMYKKDEIDKRVDKYLGILHLLEAKDRMPADISGGMRKRASLARVLVKNPEIILYDEPTSGLDPVMSCLISELIRQMQRDYGVTSVVVTHDMNSAYQIADRIAMLYRGEIIQCDVPEKIKHSDNPIVSQFVNGELSGPIRVY